VAGDENAAFRMGGKPGGMPLSRARMSLAKKSTLHIPTTEISRMTQTYTAAVTLLVLLLYFVVAANVGRARGKYGVKAPAVTGNEHFERAYRVQMNTLEQMVFLLPSLWLSALLVSDKAAALGGLIWIVGRAIYAVAYTRDPSLRGLGFGIAMFGAVGLFLGATYGVISALL
jgi:glutathione S-transferase